MGSLVPIVANQVVALLLGVVGMKLISHFVPPAVNGAYALFVTLAQLGVMLSHSGIINYALRCWQREQDQAGAFVRFLGSSSLRATAWLVPLLAGAGVVVAVRTGESTWLWLLPALLLGNVANAGLGVAVGLLGAGRRQWGVLVLNSVAGAARIGLPIGLVVLTHASFLVLGLGYAAHALVTIGAVVAWFGWAWAAAPAGGERLGAWGKELRDYGRPFALVGIGAWLLQSADRWVVAQFFGSAPAGLFAFASSIGTIVPTFAVGSLMPVVFPGVFRAADQARSRGDWRRIARQCDQITGILLILAVVGLVAAWAIAPHLVGPLIAPAYRDSVVMIVPAGLAALAAQVNQFNYMLLQGQHKSMDMVRVMFAVAGVKTLGSIIAAAWSWPIFLSWLVLSPVVCGWLGRTLIRRYALGPAGGTAITEAGISDRTGDPPG